MTKKRKKGFYSKKSSEMLSLGAKGNIWKHMRKKADQMINFVECGRHSENPVEVYELLEECFDCQKI